MRPEASARTVVRLDAGAGDEAPQPTARTRPLLHRLRLARQGLGVWIGLLVTVAGFGAIAYTWGKVAALTDVAAQLPYVVSGGLAGIGLILVGLVLINLTVKRREADDRERQLEELRQALVRLRGAIEGTPEGEE